jgi:hypothetical protein
MFRLLSLPLWSSYSERDITCSQAKKGYGARGKRKEVATSAEVEDKDEEEEQ